MAKKGVIPPQLRAFAAKKSGATNGTKSAKSAKPAPVRSTARSMPRGRQSKSGTY